MRRGTGVAKRIIEVIYSDLTKRSGIGDAFETVDDEVLEEMFAEWEALIKAELVK